MSFVKHVSWVIVFLLHSLYCHAQDWKFYRDSADILKVQKNLAGAMAFYTKAKEVLPKDSALSGSNIEVLKNIADIYFSNGDYQKAASLYLEANDIFLNRNEAKTMMYASNADRLGVLYYQVADYSKSEIFFTKAQKVRQELFGLQSAEYAQSCNNLGNLYSKIGHTEFARQFYTDALNIREKRLPADSAGFAQSCNNLADLYRLTGDYENAEPLALRAREVRAKLLIGKDSLATKPYYAISCTNLANLYRDLGQYQKAEALYMEAKKIREEVYGNEHPVYAESCNILADLYGLMAENGKAERLYLEAKEIRLKSGKNYSYAQSCNNLANLYQNMGAYKNAEILALEAKAIMEQILDKDNPSLAINNNGLGALYAAMGKYRKAEYYFLQARKLWKKQFGIRHPYYTQNSLNLARIYWNVHDFKKANDLYSSAFDQQFDQLKKIFQFTSETEKQLYLGNVNESIDEYQSFYYKSFSHANAEEAYTIALLNHNLTLNAALQLRHEVYKKQDAVIAKQYQDWISLKKRQAYLLTKTGVEQAEQVSTIQDSADIIEKEMSRKSGAFKKIHQLEVSWKGIQKKLNAGDAAIEFIAFQFYNGSRWTDSTFYAALLLKKDSPAPVFISLFEQKQLNAIPELNSQAANSSSYYRGIGLKKKVTTSGSAYNLIWKPLEKYLIGVNRIFFAEAGDLFRVPFAALPITSDKVLSDKYQLIQLNSTASISTHVKDFVLPADKIQLYGGIEYSSDTAQSLPDSGILVSAGTLTSLQPLQGGLRGSSFQFLPGTREEVRNIEMQAENKVSNVVILEGAEATEASFKLLDGASSPSVLHIATHGFFFPPPINKHIENNKSVTGNIIFSRADNPLLRAGLLFAGANNTWEGKLIDGPEDGIVTAYEISNMYLPNTKLVALSACETALGDIQGSEGVFGLQRAFKIAGVQNLIMSLWAVPDKEASEFMTEFYKKLFNNESIEDAFYQTQTYMKNKYRKEPLKWAAWILVR